MKLRKTGRLVGLVAALALLFSLAACGGEDTSSDISRVESESGSAASKDASAEDASASGEDASASGASEAGGEDSSASVAGEDASADGSAPAADASVATAPVVSAVYAGRFICTDENRFEPARAPYLEIDADGRGEFRFNSGMGLGSVYGTCTLQGGTLTLVIDSMDDSGVFEEGFQGSNMGALSFAVQDDNTLVYQNTNYGLSLKGDVFVRDGQKGEAMQTTAPPAESQSGEEPQDSSAPQDGSGSAPQSGPEDSSAGGDASGSDASGASDASASQPDDSSADASASLEPGEVPVVGPSDMPPAEMMVGESFKLVGVAGQVSFDKKFLSVELSEDGDGVVVTAVKKGEAEIEYSLAEDNEPMKYTIAIADEGGGFALWMVAAIAGGSLVLGAAVTFIVLGLGKKKKKTGAEDGEAPLEEIPVKTGLAKKARAELVKAKNKAKKTAAKAKKANAKAEAATKNSAKAANAAAKAQSEADEAARAVAPAELALQQAIKDEAESAVTAAQQAAEKAAEKAAKMQEDVSEGAEPAPKEAKAEPGSTKVLGVEEAATADDAKEE